MEAPSREAVFSALRGRGIRPIKVVAADGAKANGELRGVRKRVVAFGAACLVLGAIVASVLAFRAGESSSEAQNGASPVPGTAFLTDQTRRQVIGDAAVIEKGIRTGWADVFASEGDRFLASFAIPGVRAGVRATSVEALEAALREEEGESAVRLSPSPSSQTLEARQITAMVEGMKREARAYIAAGGTAVEYGRRLTERQDAEIAVYRRVEAELLAAQKGEDDAAFTALQEKRNDELRNLGIRPVTLAE